MQAYTMKYKMKMKYMNRYITLTLAVNVALRCFGYQPYRDSVRHRAMTQPLSGNFINKAKRKDNVNVDMENFGEKKGSRFIL